MFKFSATYYLVLFLIQKFLANSITRIFQESQTYFLCVIGSLMYPKHTKISQFFFKSVANFNPEI
jgi:hypothetical protein